MQTDYFRIEKAIRYLENHFKDQPDLEELARYVNLSRYHFQRLFSRWAGVSPKRFLQFLTIDYAKQLLEQHCSVLDASYQAGLSGPGRLHDVFVTVDAVTPGEFKSRGERLRIHYGIHPSPFGDCLLAVTERGICGLSFIDDAGVKEAVADLQLRWENAALSENPRRTGPLMELIFRAPEGGPGRSVELFLKGTNFQIKVWEALLRIPPGFVCSYEDVAAFLGRPAALRAVGNAVASNPVAYLIPCHRVIRKVGAFGEYRYGAARKKIMIGWEMAKKDRER
jgi:AraC family transcriptional regulator of adaptative response/methylated-DNA-[protein]-cysteine methyltransferase